MSFFGAVKNFDEIPDDPFAIPNGTYLCEITEATHQATKKDETKFGILLKYQIIEGDYQTSFPFSGWLNTPNITESDLDADGNIKDPEKRRDAAQLKKHFMAYGFAVNELHTVSDESLLGCSVYVTIKTVEKDGFKNIRVTNVQAVETIQEQRLNGDGRDIFAFGVNDF